MKKAFLIIGPSVKDVFLSTNELYNTLDNYTFLNTILSENNEIDSFVKNENFDPLCKDIWNMPIKKQIISNFLESIDEICKNSYIENLLICSTYSCDPDVKEEYINILNKNGYEVEIRGIYTPFFKLMTEPNSIKNGKLFNQSFGYTYVPNKDKPISAIICGKILVTGKPGFDEIRELIRQLNFQGYHLDILYFACDYEILKDLIDSMRLGNYTLHMCKSSIPVEKSKMNIFKKQIREHMNVHIVFETDLMTYWNWLELEIPTIFIMNSSNMKF